ncbi:recombinase family protein [Pseudarthrobacter sp. H2]|uniref:recombinase family protein n=1 Tax=Pseudarthrobacter sp. H2 TaxID=3418415 RepID=UPI003CE994C4
MRLKDWAISQGIHTQTAYKRFRDGTLTVPARRVGPRLIIVSPESSTCAAAGGLGLYTRVSSPDRKQDLERQMARLQAWAGTTGLPVIRAESEGASGMNGARSGIRRLLADQAPGYGVANAARMSAGRHRWGSTDDGWFLSPDGEAIARG